MPRIVALTALLLGATAPLAAHAENSKPQPLPYVNTVPDAKDVPYPGMLKIDIDATDVDRRIFTIQETLTGVQPGHMVLFYPQWVPGGHSPRADLDKLASLHIYAGGKEIAWRRDDEQLFAFHVEVPAGATALDIRFQYLSATASNQGGVVVSPTLMRLQFLSQTLYPAGYFARQIPVQATVKYPEGWTAASGLPSTHEGSTYHYEPTTYEILVDSPVLAGKYYKQWQLSPRVFLDTFADNPKELAAKPEQIDAHKRLVEQAVKTFGVQHYDNYHFLFSIGESIGGQGLEHHRSSEDGTGNGYFTDWDANIGDRNLLPHEYGHSWIGKFRRGADLWTPTYNVPMRGTLLWAYEGLDQYWGYVLQARAGLVSKQDTLDQYASIMASLENRSARQWRNLLETGYDPPISQRRPKGWVSWQRSEDYYNEGLLVWMEVDSILREQSKGSKSIDDFIRAFVGFNEGDYGEVTYTFDDIVRILDGIQPYDWRGLLTRRLTETGQPAPLGGFVRDGYKLIYNETPTATFRQGERTGGGANLNYSLGLAANREGALTNVQWDSPAFAAKLIIGDTLVAVNGQAYSADKLKDAVTAAKTGTDPIRLTIKAGDQVRDVTIDYHGGLRYPHLEKIGKGASGLDQLLTPR